MVQGTHTTVGENLVASCFVLWQNPAAKDRAWNRGPGIISKELVLVTASASLQKEYL